MMMKIQDVTFTQDNNSGTETTMNLKQPWALKDSAPMNIGKQSVGVPKSPEATQPGENIKPTE
jgi:hypothetical protein